MSSVSLADALEAVRAAAERDALRDELSWEAQRAERAVERARQLEDAAVDDARELGQLREALHVAEQRAREAEAAFGEIQSQLAAHRQRQVAAGAAEAEALSASLEIARVELADLEAEQEALRERMARRPRAHDVDDDGRPTWVPHVPIPRGPISRPELRVACVLDPFSVAAYRYEMTLIQFGQDDWKDVIERDRPHFLLVESAWRGNEGRWNYTLAKREGPKPAMIELVAWCKEQGIPTVFWNKEDPSNFDLFIKSALLFDHIFTVDVNCVPRYRDEFGHRSVHVLPFAAQPRLNGPVAVKGGRPHSVAFAGTYYGDKHPHRKKQMEVVLEPATDYDLKIFSRFEGDERYHFPSGLRECVVGSLPYEDMLTANKMFKVFLNVNSVVDSPTMCARRIFELLCAGTSVVSGQAPAIENLLGPYLVFQSGSADETRQTLRMLLRNPEIRDRTAVRGIREIMRAHTYAHRVDQVLDVLGLDARRSVPTVSIVCPTNRPQYVDQVFANVARQSYRPLELVLVLHGLDLDAADVRRRAMEQGIDNVTVLRAEPELTLGACMNLGCEAAQGQILSKMDDDNFYGEHYMEDLVNAFSYTSAAVVGKWSVYTYLSSSKTMVLRFPEKEFRYVRLVQGGSLTMRRDTWEDLRFPDLPRAVDTEFLERVRASKAKIFSTDRFNYVSVRAADTAGHTWKISEESILATGEAHVFGATYDHVVV